MEELNEMLEMLLYNPFTFKGYCGIAGVMVDRGLEELKENEELSLYYLTCWATAGGATGCALKALGCS
jgi:hypothetical protein